MPLVFYRCNHCGNIAIKAHDAGVPLVCCGEQMEKLVPDTTDAALEKHVPDVTIDGSTVKVQIGSIEHPMIPEHHIEIIALETEKGYQIVELTADDTPHATFAVAEGDAPVRVYEYCNIHGLWMKEL